MKTTTSQKLFSEAQQVIPGGVNSPVRAFRQVGGTPIFMQSAKGAYLFDADDNRYIDYINSWGPMILGHSHPQVVEALKIQVEKAVSFGAPTLQETDMAKLIVSMVPGLDMIRFVNPSFLVNPPKTSFFLVSMLMIGLFSITINIAIKNLITRNCSLRSGVSPSGICLAGFLFRYPLACKIRLINLGLTST